MKDINKRFKILREHLNISQESFGNKIGLSKSGISNIESGHRNVTDKHVKLIHSQFNISEEWLKTGKGEMIIQPETFSLDEYAQKNKLSQLEFDIIRGYIELDSNVRQSLLLHFKSIFDKHSESVVTNIYDYKEMELNDYRLELETEKNTRMLSVLDGSKDKKLG